MTRGPQLILFLVATALISGCATHNLLSFTLLSSHDVELSRGPAFEQGPTPTHGEDTLHIITIVPVGSLSIQTALDNALRSVPGCVAIKNGNVTRIDAGVPFVYMQSKIVVEGYPIIDPKLAGGVTTSPGAASGGGGQ